MGDITVEVCDNGVWFKAFVTDLVTCGLVVVFENIWKKDCFFSFDQVRLFSFDQVHLPPNESSIDESNQQIFSEGMEVDVLTRSNGHKNYGWRSANIKKKIGRYFVIKYSLFNWEIVTAERLRLKNPNPTFHRCVLRLPDDLLDNATINSVQDEFKEKVQDGFCQYIPHIKGLLLISTNQELLAKFKDEKLAHFQSLRQKKGNAQSLEPSDNHCTAINSLYGASSNSHTYESIDNDLKDPEWFEDPGSENSSFLIEGKTHSETSSQKSALGQKLFDRK